MRAAEIRFFWYRAELFSLFSRLPRARCSRGAPFLFFPSSTRRAKKTRGASETTRQWYASNEFKSLPKEHVFRKRRIPSLSLLFSKSSRQERNRPKGCSSEKDARTKSRHKRKTRKGYLGGGGGCQTSAKERLALGKEYKGRQTELQFFSFFEFRVLEKRFESLNVFQAFVSSSFCLSLSRQY